MPFRMSDAMANAILDGGVVLDNYVLEVRSGAQPGSANTAPSGTVLATMTLPATALAAAASRAKAKAGTWSDASADATGVAGYLRIRTAIDNGTTDATQKRMDMDLTTTGGGGTATIDNTSIASSQPVTVNSVSIAL